MARYKKYKEKYEEEKERNGKPKLNLSRETKRGIAVICFVVLALISVLSLVQIAGSLGTFWFNALTAIFGSLAYLVPVLFLLVAIALYKQDLEGEDREKSFYFRTYLGAILLFGSFAGIIHIFYVSSTVSGFSVAGEGKGGGYLGAIFAQPVFSALGFWGGSIILIALIIVGILITFDLSLQTFLPKKKEEAAAAETANAELKINNMGTEGFVSEKVIDKNKKLPEEAPVSKDKLSTTIHTGQTNSQLQREAITLEDRKDWKLPPFDLLDDNKTEVDSGDIEMNVSVIKKT